MSSPASGGRSNWLILKTMNNKLFVYGTLMNDVQSNIARFLRDNSRFLGLGYAKGTLYDLGFYPGFVPDENEDSRVTGHVFELKKCGADAARLG